MKHILYTTTGIALALGFAVAATPASADVDVFASITKDKDIVVLENITVNKTATITVGAQYELHGAAEAQAVLNVDNHGNRVNGADPSNHLADDDVDTPVTREPLVLEEYGIHLDASMSNSVNDNTGVFGFNQDVGNMSNQGNVVSVAGITQIDAVADSQAHADQRNYGNSATEFERLRDTQGNPITVAPGVNPDNFKTNKHALIQNSINDNTGVINVNQNAGNMNNQSNGVSAAVGIGALVALSDADLGQLNSGNYVHEVETVKVGTIEGSVNGNTGVVNVNQSTGNMNNQGNVVSVSAITSGAFIGTNNP